MRDLDNTPLFKSPKPLFGWTLSFQHGGLARETKAKPAVLWMTSMPSRPLIMAGKPVEPLRMSQAKQAKSFFRYRP